MKKVKTIVTGSILAMAVLSAIAQCAISTGSPACPGTIPGPGGHCYNLTGTHDTAREACVGENGNNPVTQTGPVCGYSCDDGSHHNYYYDIVIGTNPCPGDSTSGLCGY